MLDTVWDKQEASLGLSVFVLFFLFRLPLRLFDKKNRTWPLRLLEKTNSESKRSKNKANSVGEKIV